MIKVNFKKKQYKIKAKNLIAILIILGYNKEEIENKVAKIKKEQQNNEECSICFLKKYGLYNEVFLQRINKLIKER